MGEHLLRGDAIMMLYTALHRHLQIDETIVLLLSLLIDWFVVSLVPNVVMRLVTHPDPVYPLWEATRS